jgi:hypothetical protein
VLNSANVTYVDPVAEVNCNVAAKDQGSELAVARTFGSGLTDIPRSRSANIALRFWRCFIRFGFVDVTAKHENEVARRVELLDAPVVSLCDVNVST